EPLAYINHIGPAAVFNTVSLSEVIDGTVDPAKIKGKAVLVGVTLTGNFDQRVTPFSNFEPGIYTHASFLSNILSQNFLTRPGGFLLLEIFFMLGAALVLAFLVPRVRFLFKAGTVVGLIVAWLALDQILFNKGLMLATVMPTISVFLTGFGVVFLGYLAVDREKGQIRNVFQHYVDKRVMEQMLQHPEKLRLGGDKKDMTVLFSDIRGFTTLAERMTPQALVEFINEYLTPMTDIVFENQGTLDKYIGDAVMCFWGAPVEQADHALRACQAAMRMLAKLDELKVDWRKRNLPDISIGVGINSGPMTAGNMGSHGRFNYTVMGDAVNLASRLEGTNKEYETNVLISEATYLQVQTDVVARRLGAVRVKGKRKPVRIYELRRMGQAEGPEAEAVKSFEAAVDAYAERKWNDAEDLFNKVLSIWEGDAPSRRYLDEIAIFRETPPGPGWDGVYTATSK
ncbi:MAG: adenylate/guanylate cyclase domain-containing protein, partial [Myxococcaceae bacterium]